MQSAAVLSLLPPRDTHTAAACNDPASPPFNPRPSAQACYKAMEEGGHSQVKHLDRGIYGWYQVRAGARRAYKGAGAPCCILRGDPVRSVNVSPAWRPRSRAWPACAPSAPSPCAQSPPRRCAVCRQANLEFTGNYKPEIGERRPVAGCVAGGYLLLAPPRMQPLACFCRKGPPSAPWRCTRFTRSPTDCVLPPHAPPICFDRRPFPQRGAGAYAQAGPGRPRL